MDANERKKLADWSKTYFECAMCGERVNKLASIGNMKCGQHAEPLDRQSMSYPCCGARHRSDPHPSRKGCVAADHTDMIADVFGMPVPFTARHDVQMSVDAITTLLSGSLDPRCVVTSDASGYFERVTIRRFADPAFGWRQK
jgi:hypothetical protein